MSVRMTRLGVMPDEFPTEDMENGIQSNQHKLMPTLTESRLSMEKAGSFEMDDEKLDYGEENKVLKYITYPVMAFNKFCSIHKQTLLCLWTALFALGITVYMIIALLWNFNRATPLLVIWLLVVGCNVYSFFRDHFGDTAWNCFKPSYFFIKRNMFWIKWVFILCIVVGLSIWIILDTSKRSHQLISGAGYLFFLFCLFVTSKYPNRVVWRPVLWGLLIQICLGMLILRTEFGFEAFNWLGNLVQIFINYVDVGVRFLFGPKFYDHYFAFKVLPIVIYFSAFISILYYLGAMQWIILKIAWIMQISLNTSATESMVAAGNIFVGQTESPLLIRPYLNDLTTSELHAVMTCGFGTIAGSVLGAYLGFGIQPVNVITACVMAAPCALAISKLVYPETKRSKFLTQEGLVLEKTDYTNVIEAACMGASQAIPLVLNIGGNLIAFLALLAATNGFLGWCGGLLDYPQLSFEVICSYLFVPITFLMGVERSDCFKTAELLGTKIFLNEFIAYEALADMIKTRDSGTIPHIQHDTGVVNWIDERSEAIITYALCGFANVGSLGIVLGTLGSMAPQRQSEISKIAIRSLIAGIFVSILNACMAGFLYIPRPIVCRHMLSTADWNFTEPARLFECCSAALHAQSNYNQTTSYNCCNSYNWTSSGYALNCSALKS